LESPLSTLRIRRPSARCWTGVRECHGRRAPCDLDAPARGRDSLYLRPRISTVQGNRGARSDCLTGTLHSSACQPSGNGSQIEQVHGHYPPLGNEVPGPIKFSNHKISAKVVVRRSPSDSLRNPPRPGRRDGKRESPAARRASESTSQLAKASCMTLWICSGSTPIAG